MQPSSSPLTLCPSTPVHSRISNARYPLHLIQRPSNSSPLASSDSPERSPLSGSQSRRRSQYKSRIPSTPAHSPVPLSPSISRIIHSSGGSVFSGGNSTIRRAFTSSGDDPQKSFLREKFRARCLERAAKARAKAIKGRRYTGPSQFSSDGFDEAMDDEDEEEDDDDIMQDELFRRIMENMNRKKDRSFKLSYSQEVGSSFDPDMEDISNWEQELAQHSTSATPRGNGPPVYEDHTPVDLDDEELVEYAEECARRAAIADFEDITEEELYNWSDTEERGRQLTDLSDDMDMS